MTELPDEVDGPAPATLTLDCEKAEPPPAEDEPIAINDVERIPISSGS